MIHAHLDMQVEPVWRRAANAPPFYLRGVAGLHANKASVNVLGTSDLFSEIPTAKRERDPYSNEKQQVYRAALACSRNAPDNCRHHSDPSPAPRDRDFRKQVVIATPIYLSFSHAATADCDFDSRLPSGEESAAGLF